MGSARSVVYDLRLVRSRLLDILDLEEQLVNEEVILDEVAGLRNLVEAMIRGHEAQVVQDQGARVPAEEAVGARP